MIYSAYFFSSKCLTLSVPPSSLSLISGQYWAHLFFDKKKSDAKIKITEVTNLIEKQNANKNAKKATKNNYQRKYTPIKKYKKKQITLQKKKNPHKIKQKLIDENISEKNINQIYPKM